MLRILFGLVGMAGLLFVYSVSPSLAWAAMVAAAYNVGKLRAGSAAMLTFES